MKAPVIYVVTEAQGDRYHLWGVNLICWFFNQREAEDWVEKQANPNLYRVDEVPGGPVEVEVGS